MYIKYKVTSTRLLLLDESANIDEVRLALAKDPEHFINTGADEMNIVLEDEYCIEDEHIAESESESTVWLYDCVEHENCPPVWENRPMRYIPDGCNSDNEFGKGSVWNFFDIDLTGEIQAQRIDEPTDCDPLESDRVAWELARLAGYELDENGFLKS